MVGDFPPLFGGFPAASNLRGVPIFAVPNCNARCSALSAGSWRGSGSCSGRRKWGVGKFRSRPNIYSPFARPVSIFFRTNRAGFGGHPILGSSDGHIDPCAR